jgi:hypothetical protein
MADYLEKVEENYLMSEDFAKDAYEYYLAYTEDEEDPEEYDEVTWLRRWENSGLFQAHIHNLAYDLY